MDGWKGSSASTPPPPHTHTPNPPFTTHRNAFGRPIYKLLLSLSLLLAINYSLASAYCLPLLQSPLQWQRRVGLAWQG
jgi:hypothetical protein